MVISNIFVELYYYTDRYNGMVFAKHIMDDQKEVKVVWYIMKNGDLRSIKGKKISWLLESLLKNKEFTIQRSEMEVSHYVEYKNKKYCRTYFNHPKEFFFWADPQYSMIENCKVTTWSSINDKDLCEELENNFKETIDGK